ncbi:MAG: pyridoxal phosphate-dependent aminotransferase [Candidatus Kapaibacterium sp.]
MITANPHLRTISAYAPGATPEQIKAQFGLEHVEKLASNENPLGCSPAARAAAIEAIDSVHLYNDGGQILRSRLAEFHGVDAASISVHNGSDAIIHQIMRTFLLPGETALSSDGTFVSFRLAVASADRTFRTVPLAGGFAYNTPALADAIDATTKVIYIANPNNPTGTHVDRQALTSLLDRVPESVLVVLDEAYVEYARHLHPDTYPSEAETSRPNVVRLRTFSKAYGLASLRVGYAVGHPDVMQWLIRTKLPFDPNGVGCAAAVAALEDQDFVRRTVELNAECLSIMSAAATDSGLHAVASSANFMMVDLASNEAATKFHRNLLEGGFISRPLASFGLPTGVRISTGTLEQTQRLAELLRSGIGNPSLTLSSSSVHHTTV